MPDKHALLGGSSAHRWLECPPSARIEENMQDITGSAAAEGTLAHAIAELKLRKQFEVMTQKTFTTRMNKLKKDPLYQEEMQRHTDTYTAYITEKAMEYESVPLVDIEAQLDYSEWAPEGFGTGDCVITGGDMLWIIDFKYGKGVQVEADHNPQLMLYALGALQKYSMIYNIQQVKMAIIQPRRDHISEWEISKTDLLQWAESYVKPRAQLAYNGGGEFCPGESQCRFCKAKGRCKALADYNLVLTEKQDTPPGMLGGAEISDVLHRVDPLLKWAEAVKDYALHAILNGETIPGWKAVEGRSIRKFNDQDAAFNALRENGIDEALLYERKPITLSAAEKMIGKQQFELVCGPYVVKPYGAPALAPESDPRKPYSTAASDFDGLEQI